MEEKTFMDIVRGRLTEAEWGAAIFFAGLTALAMLAYRVRKRNRESLRTPEHWSWRFFFMDTLPQNFGTVVLILISIRLCQKWFVNEAIVYGSVVLGLLSDQIVLFFTKIRDRAGQIVNNKIDDLADQLGSTNRKVINTGQDVKEVKDDVKEIKEKLDGN